MKSLKSNKSTPEEIRQRFDNDVERFSNLETGQTATIDAPLVMDLITSAAAATNPQARHILDVGCGAGNYTLKLLQRLPNLNVTLIDLSKPMLDRALVRVSQATTGSIQTLQGDIRELPLDQRKYDIILAAMVLHHLRNDNEWLAVFQKFHHSLNPGGWIWIADFIRQSTEPVQAMMWQGYGEYLKRLRDETYRDHVLAYVEREDTPRDLMFQIATLRKAGFGTVEILHKNNCFGAFGAQK